MDKKYLALFIFFCIFLIPVVSALTIENSPSANTGKANTWTSPTNAYSYNSLYTSESTSADTHVWFNYSFNIPSDATITSVKVHCKKCKITTAFSQDVFIAVSNDSGTTFYNILGNEGYTALGLTESYTNKTKDFSAVYFTPETLNDTYFRVYLRYWQQAACYPNRTYLLGWNETAKEQENKWLLINIEDLKVGDKIFALDDFTKQLIWTEVKQIDVHKGLWIMRDIYSGNLTVQLSEKEQWEWKAHNIFTANHPVEYTLPDGTIRRGIMKDLQVGYSLFHVFHDPPYFGRYVSPEEHYTKAFPITKIIDYKYSGTVYNVITTNYYERPVLKYLSDEEIAEMTSIAKIYYNMSFAQFFDPPISKQTAYVDWLPVEVTYTIPTTPIKINLTLNGTQGNYYYQNKTIANFTVISNVTALINLTANITNWTDYSALSPYCYYPEINCTLNDTWYNITAFTGNESYMGDSVTHHAICYVITTTTTTTTTIPIGKGIKPVEDDRILMFGYLDEIDNIFARLYMSDLDQEFPCFIFMKKMMDQYEALEYCIGIEDEEVIGVGTTTTTLPTYYTIKLDVLEDAWIYNNTPDTNYGSALTLLFRNTSDNNVSHGLIKLNNSIPSGKTIDNITLFAWIELNNLDSSAEGYNISVHHLSNQTWTEEDPTWNNFNDLGTWNTTKEDDYKIFGGTGEPVNIWLNWSITNMGKEDYDKNNISVYLQTHDYFGTPIYTDFIQVRSKENNPDPYANATYH